MPCNGMGKNCTAGTIIQRYVRINKNECCLDRKKITVCDEGADATALTSYGKQHDRIGF